MIGLYNTIDMQDSGSLAALEPAIDLAADQDRASVLTDNGKLRAVIVSVELFQYALRHGYGKPGGVFTIEPVNDHQENEVAP